MALDFVLTGYTPGDRAEACALQDPLLRGGPEGNGSYLDWKYLENPYLDGRYVVLARTPGGALAGMVGVFGSGWEVDGQRFVLPCLTDTIVAPEHRNGPVFHAMVDEVLARLRRDNVPWLLDFGDQGTVPAMLIRGWQQVGPWGQAVLNRPAGHGFRGPWSALPDARGTRSGVTITAATAPDVEAMAAVAAALPGDGRVRVARTASYFGWRAANPLAKYYYLLARSETGAVEGYLVAHRSGVDTDDGPTPTTVVDCEASSDDVQADLVRLAAETLPGTRFLLWTRDLPDPVLKELAGLGAEFVEPTGRPTRDRPLPSLLIRATGAQTVPAALADLVKPDSWDFRGVSGRGWR
ncbi:GNAT family N-acetyltransferase [Amycolatopsis sp. FBCC-B4732]|uniref:GNAT family N-acetyltransferase n=1 Tax=Amycolatopsis sp. FBCC-B4732 TaxID=3079339 RepID=UPI001FF639F9|nr:GNAT family N-acetyltransferase [Amycolatopsis sp. FBCC-B4732]UOX92985.1 GNAT family N-acetyltransferase [Amycolatopsis sp. FBCC-B4732]